jgi:serine protease Do
VTIQDVTPEMAKLFKLNGPHGALISEVMRRSPAESAGLRAGDVVVGVNGRKIQTFNQLSRYVALVAPGNKAELLVLRDGAEKTFAVKVGERPEDEKLAMARGGEPDQPEAASDDLLGISVQPLSSARAHRMGVDSGVQIVSVDPDGPAARAGARAGDVIVEMQRRGIRSPSDYQAALGMLKPGDMALLRLQRQNASIYLAIRIPSR